MLELCFYLLGLRRAFFRATRDLALVTLSLVPFSFALATATFRVVVTIPSIRSATSRGRETRRAGGAGRWYGGMELE
jgi:hypothetical protein